MYWVNVLVLSRCLPFNVFCIIFFLYIHISPMLFTLSTLLNPIVYFYFSLFLFSSFHDFTVNFDFFLNKPKNKWINKRREDKKTFLMAMSWQIIYSSIKSFFLYGRTRKNHINCASWNGHDAVLMRMMFKRVPSVIRKINRHVQLL